MRTNRQSLLRATSLGAALGLFLAVPGCAEGPADRVSPDAGSASSTGGSLGNAGGSGRAGGPGDAGTGGHALAADGGNSPASAGGAGGAGGGGGAASTSTGGATGTGDGLQVGSICFPKCASAATDPDGDGYGTEAGRSCVVIGSAPALGAPACVPPPPTVTIPPGDGFYLGGMCYPRCASDLTDLDPVTGIKDGWGYEHGAACVVSGSIPALQGLPCIPPTVLTGNGYRVVDPAGNSVCEPSCKHPELADSQGYGFEAQQGCVVDGSLAALQNAPCTLAPRILPPAGNGFLLGESCFPPCGATATNIVGGYGWDLNRACVVTGSVPSIQGIPCVPPPATVTGACPQVLQCPVVNGTALPCGCTWVVGLGARKQQIMATAGATQYLLASAMLETATLTADYALGDGKTGDSFNAGICKQNWGMTRRCHPAWNAMTAAQFSTSAAMNSNLTLDVQVYNECRNMFGANWWSGHRAGFGSLGANTQDIQEFKGAMDWINAMLAGHLTDDVRVWVTIRAI
jgi:hypothetical protein